MLEVVRKTQKKKNCEVKFSFIDYILYWLVTLYHLVNEIRLISTMSSLKIDEIKIRLCFLTDFNLFYIKWIGDVA